MSTCVVMLCNKAYFDKFIETCRQLLTVGAYTGPICLVIGDDLLDNPCLQDELIVQNSICIKHFPDIPFTDEFIEAVHDIPRDRHWFKKIFQYHKLYLFDPYFKQWEYIFYIDCGIHIHSDIRPILNERLPNRLLAHSDAYPSYERTLATNFTKDNPELFDRLHRAYNLNIDYFQTTIMLYDTNICNDVVVKQLIALAEEYPISITNDQGIIALYFTNIEPVFTQIKIRNGTTYLYDYLPRNPDNTYIMTKLWNTTVGK